LPGNVTVNPRSSEKRQKKIEGWGRKRRGSFPLVGKIMQVPESRGRRESLWRIEEPGAQEVWL